MADSNSLKVVCLFEAGARLGSNCEIIGLSACIYHRFIRERPEIIQYELFTFAAACIKLAHWFYEQPVASQDLATVMFSVVHGPQQFLDSNSNKKLEQSIELAAKIIAINLNFQVDYTSTKRLTPGLLLQSNKSNISTDNTVITVDDSSSSSSSDDDDDLEQELMLLSKNDRHQISSHRYLAHYLMSIRMLVEPGAFVHFKKLSNIAWTLLCDIHWSPTVTQHFSNHLACTCLMMAIDICGREFNCRNSDKAYLWKLINKKWHLIFCDDLDSQQLERMKINIAQQYDEFERIFEHEFSLYVIDPTSGS